LLTSNSAIVCFGGARIIQWGLTTLVVRFVMALLEVSNLSPDNYMGDILVQCIGVVLFFTTVMPYIIAFVVHIQSIMKLLNANSVDVVDEHEASVEV